MRHRILVVAEDVTLRSMLARWLMPAGYFVELAETDRRAREVLADQRIALTIVAPSAGVPMFEPGEKGGKLIVAIERSQDPGRLSRPLPRADAYLSTPLDQQEVLAQVESVLRPSLGANDAALRVPEILSFDGFTIDLAGRSLCDSGGSEVPLTRAEFALLVVLARHPGRVLSRDQLLNAALGRRAEPYDRSVDVLVGRLRRKIEPDPKAPRFIITMPGEGYKFAAQLGENRSPAQTTFGAPAEEEPSARPPLIERRQLTVTSCGLLGSAALAARLDPEDLRVLLADYHRCCADVIAPFGGMVAPSSGDRVLAYFGYPEAHENDAESAVRAGLALVDAVAKLASPLATSLHLRVGIASGLVVAGSAALDGALREPVAIGEAPELAAQLQSMASPDTVVIAASTRDLVRGLFDYCEVGRLALEGLDEPVPAWQVVRASAAESRFEALRGSVLTPLVGRDEEIGLLLRRWARAKAGNGQVVLISGEPGIGKSRIAAALAEHLHTEPYLRLRYFCSPNHQDSALFPFIDQLGRAAGFAREDPSQARLEKLEALLAGATPADEDVAFLADLLSVPASGRHSLPNPGPQRKKERTLEALIRQLEGLALQQPVLIVFEDAQWIDPTSRELLDLTVERVLSLPVLLIVTFRPEFQQPWTGQPQVTMLALSRLDRHDRAALVEHLAGGKALPDEVMDQIAERTDGVPLFVEELTKSVLESGSLHEEADRYVLDGALLPFAIPATLHASLLARLDRLASARLVAQIGAAIGREFSYALLRVVSHLPDDELQSALARLVASELVLQRASPPDAVYAFKHALVQDAAHGSLLRSARHQLHARIAEALEARSPELIDAQPELLAQHYAEAGLVEKSVAFWGKAGRRSAARSAMAEAAAQFQKGLDQLALLANTTECQRRKLEYYSARGAALRAAKGFAAPETGNAYARAQELWEQLGSPSEFLHIPFGQSRYHSARGELDLSMSLDEDLLRLSRERNDTAGLVLGHLSAGRNLMHAGRLALSRSHLEEVLALHDPASHRSLVHQIGFQPHINSQDFLGIVLFCLGFPDQALALSDASVAEARTLAHLPTLAGSLAVSVRLLSLVGDDAALNEQTKQLVAVTTEQGFPLWRALGAIFRGLFEVRNGDVREGMSLLRSGSTAYRVTGAEFAMAYYTALLAEASEIAGQVEEAAILLDDALQIIERTGERWFAAELNRRKGRLLLRQGHSEIADELYRKALSIAEEQEAKLWELRAAMSLAQLRRDQDRRAEARDLLAPVYGWFTEGFGTPDLKDAKALLDELDA